MEDFRKLAKIAALNQKIPGPVCGNPDCEDLCAEVYDAALSLRLDPAVTIRKTVERSLHCLPANAGAVRSCRFGFVPVSNSLVLGGDKKKKGDNEVIHIFRTGINECKKCQALGGTRIFPDVWVNEEKMKDWGFRKQENGEYLPHSNCKCHWAEKEVIRKKWTKKQSAALTAAFKKNHIISNIQASQLADDIIEVMNARCYAKYHLEESGKVFLVFNGMYLMSSDGKLLLPAVSGKPVEVYEEKGTISVPFGYARKGRTKHFSYHTGRQEVENQGPLPQGIYLMSSRESGSVWKGNFKKHIIERAARGNYHWRLFPMPETNMRGRKIDSFTIHGGIEPESSGCIDLTSGDAIFRKYLQSLEQDDFLLAAQYPRQEIFVTVP